MVWAIDFQFGATVDGKAVKIASMIDEHTRLSLLHLVERSITAERLVTELEAVFAVAGGPPKVLRMDNGPKLVSQALQQFCETKVEFLHSAGYAVEQRVHRIVQQPPRSDRDRGRRAGGGVSSQRVQRHHRRVAAQPHRRLSLPLTQPTLLRRVGGPMTVIRRWRTNFDPRPDVPLPADRPTGKRLRACVLRSGRAVVVWGFVFRHLRR